MAANKGTAATGKRTRLQNEEDQSSAVKRRRTRASEQTDGQETKSSAAASGAPSRRGRIGASQAAKEPRENAYEVPASDEEEPPQPRRQRPALPRTDGETRAGKAKSSTSSDQRSSVYDVPDSEEDEIAGAAAVAPRPGRQQRDGAAPGADGIEPAPTAAGREQPEKRKRGRPRKRDPDAMAPARAAEISTAAEPARRTRRPAGRPAAEGTPEPEPRAGAANGLVESKARARARAAADPKPGRARDAAVPKGILTPRGRKRALGGRQKNVSFEDQTDADDRALARLAAASPSGSARQRREAAEAMDELQVGGPRNDDETSPVEAERGKEEEKKEKEDDEDDEVCAICSKPDSEPPNEIVFCDSCDMPVHQECYGLAEIPEGDWICRNCSQDDAATTGSSIDAPGRARAVAVAREEQRPDIPNFEQHLRSMQRVLLDRCTGRRRIRLRGQDEAYSKAYQLVEQTVAAGEGNSMMVIGARGCGKTTLVESIIEELSRKHRDQFHVVRLSGFIHTDDKLALREIWRQLGKEMDVEDELVNKTTNHADTMASLLALLSHPSEISEAPEGVTSRSVVFVIDEFDLFATHARQTLLYNLFDIAQARKAPIAVLGLTTRFDVVESLEKRVKSRFSHRYVYLSLPKSLPAYWDVCRQGLTIDEEDMSREGIDRELEGHGAFWDWWNNKIGSLRTSQGFTDLLESHYYGSKSVSAFLTACILPLAALSPAAPSLQIPAAAGLDVSLEPPDSKLHLLGSLSDLDLSMLIAAARLDIVAHTDTVNFAMAYDEYTSLMGRQRLQSAGSGMLALGGGARVWGRGVAGMAWERLAALGLLVPAAAGGRGTAGLAGLDAKMWKVDVALEEIPAAVKLNAVLARWCREI
ncbi:hypothetical protein VTH06DRAFT_3029 [Thermothelomyces fergusii]